jgi:hypothetical protein
MHKLEVLDLLLEFRFTYDAGGTDVCSYVEILQVKSRLISPKRLSYDYIWQYILK